MPILQEAPYMIIRVSSKSKSGSRWCMELLDIEGSMRTVPRQESVSNQSKRFIVTLSFRVHLGSI